MTTPSDRLREIASDMDGLALECFEKAVPNVRDGAWLRQRSLAIDAIAAELDERERRVAKWQLGLSCIREQCTRHRRGTNMRTYLRRDLELIEHILDDCGWADALESVGQDSSERSGNDGPPGDKERAAAAPVCEHCGHDKLYHQATASRCLKEPAGVGLGFCKCGGYSPKEGESDD